MTVCVISQPRLFPGLHYLHRMLLADVFVVLDTVPFNPRHEENRAKIRTASGWRWLTVPMHRTGRSQLIADTAVADTPWRQSAKGILEASYRGTAGFAKFGGEVMQVLDADRLTTLDQITAASWEPAIHILGIQCSFVRASALGPRTRGSQQILDLALAVGADKYITGDFGRQYLDRNAFGAAGIELLFHSFDPAPYPQVYDGFVPYLSYVDALFSVGLDSAEIRAQGTVLSD